MTTQTLAIVINFDTKCEKMQHITLRTYYLQQQNQQNKKTYNSCKLVFKIHEHKKQERHTLEEKGCTQNFQKRKLHAKLQKSYKNITNTMKQEQDEKVNQTKHEQ